MHSELLGYDIRLFAEDYVEARWDQNSRAIYLLRPDIKWPLSVDQMVWPSFFCYSNDRGAGYFELDETIEVTPSTTRHSALELWPSLEDMKTCFTQQPVKRRKKGIEIAVMLLAHEPSLSREYWHAVLEPALSPNEPPKGWEFLGYDVADEYMLSGLVNCGYSEDEKISLKKKWSNRLNEFGLLTILEDASEFREITDRRVPEHRPFFIYGLFSAPVTKGGCRVPRILSYRVPRILS
jgi:hypothetical protein